MTRSTWADIATALAALRTQLETHARRYQSTAHRERIIGVELAARVICRTLRSRSSRFSARQFMKIVGAHKK